MLTVEQLRGTAPLPDPLPIGERLSGLFAARVRALDADARTVLLLAAAERLGDPTLLRRAADADRRAVVGRGSRERRGERARRRSPRTSSSAIRSCGRWSTTRPPRPIGAAPMPRSPRRSTQTLDADRRAWHLGAAAAEPDEQIARVLEASAERARQRGGASAAAFFLWRAGRAHARPRARPPSGSSRRRAPSWSAGRGPRAQEILDRARATGLADRASGRGGVDRGADPHRRRRRAASRLRCWPRRCR